MAVLTGELDVTAVPLLRAQLRGIAAARPRRLVIDAAGVSFIDCAAARTLVAVRRCLPRGQRLVIRSPSPIVALVLRLTGLAELCEITELTE
jgi:anti-sigma B factor antagonist